ncbi:AMP-binding protein [Liquorilactobacillus vini]|uniref:AMP-dependent synthetase and ligase n=1 Tax=Liquorilactobacillus vini DSM 20605 TaxID=1133569 RepID=A0A0R2CFF1_9LACO|nr:AMP-binding protein [Liquorilactobacillus vini]KRM88724.1 AMP-dependent synthetase and ligase [Liquorilactobacillus vini DSM 20605]
MSPLISKINEILTVQPDKKIIKDLAANVWLTRKQTKNAINQLTDFFQSINLRPNDRILVTKENSAVYPLIMLAAYKYGLLIHPAAPSLTANELENELTAENYQAVFPSVAHFKLLQKQNMWRQKELSLEEDLSCHIFYKVDDNCSNLSKSLIDSPIATQPALMMYTSGTTGKPKKVILTHENLLTAAQFVIQSQQLTAADRTLIVLPLFHINAQIIAMLSTLLSGGCVLLPLKFSASHFWQQVKDEKITWVSASPSVISILLANKKAQQNFVAPSSLRFLRSASAPLSSELQQRFEKKYQLPIIQGYGMTEAAGQICVNPLEHSKRGSVGKPIGTKVSILINNRPAKLPKQIGEVLLKGKNVITSYANRDPSLDFIDGWLRTGDLGYFDSDGYLYLTGRSKELINYGGHKISPLKIENVLLQADFVCEAAAVGIFDQLFGEKIVAVIVLNDSVNQAIAKKELTQLLEKDLAKFERPQQLIFVNKLPHNRVGKILRFQLQQELNTQGGSCHE